MCSSSQKTDSLTGSNRRIPLHPAIGWWNLCSSDRHPSQMLGGVIPLSPSPSQSTAQPPGLSRAAPSPHSRCTSPPLDRQVLTLSQGALTQWTHLFPWPLSFDFQPQPTTWGRVWQEPLAMDQGPSRGAWKHARPRRQNKQCLVQEWIN